ncbi:MAG TPA: HlyD family efflux transporter periplasmic adaptor subunit [Clostridiales bacterium]|nr:HlyD family efflux transporter periplasmic adaptor subunit [Clostridiales bacterium]
MKDLKQYKKQGIVLLILCLGLVTAMIVYHQSQQAEKAEATVKYEDVAVTSTTIQQTLTAAGEVQTAKEETLLFSKSKTFKGMCTEVKEHVTAGDPIALYSDGSALKAEHSGVVSAINPPRTGSKGDGAQGVTFLPDDQIAIHLTVPEDEISRITLGDTAKVVINAEPEQEFSGVITYVSGSSDDAIKAEDGATQTNQDNAENGDENEEEDGADMAAFAPDDEAATDNGAYFKAVVNLDNDGSLKIGMSASCTVLLAEKQDILAVPVNAVSIAGTERYVNVVKADGSVTKTKVETGISDATYVEIVSGLKGDETVRVAIMRKGETK